MHTTLKMLILMVIALIFASLTACSSNASGNKGNDKVKVYLTALESSATYKDLQTQVFNTVHQELEKNNNIVFVKNMKEADVLYSIAFIPLTNLKKQINEDYMAYSVSFVDIVNKRYLHSTSCLWLNNWTEVIKPSTEGFNDFISRVHAGGN